jgi:LytS/YehU family sensor histidine kinase
MLAHPWVRLDIHIEKDFLEFKLTNNKPEYNNESPGKKGIGLNNVKKRLELLYPETHSLKIVESDMSYEVFMKIALHSSEDKIKQDTVTNKKEVYELA